ncbi:MAG: hypothetical protein PHG24_01550 [Candidatus Pacebacteria bacterium]|nr:hypothetical protein [Candidatus Paceibacterota bacterium]
MKIYPTITTLVDYKEKIEEINALKLEKVCVFLTGLNFEERKELFKELEKTTIKEIPFVHIRNDVKTEELDFLINRYKTKVFNLHSKEEHPSLYDYSKYKDSIYIENVYNVFSAEDLLNWAGICLDFSHLENDRLMCKERYKKNLKIIKNSRIGCCHISAIKDTYYIDRSGEKRYDNHSSSELSEFDYLKKYDKKFFSEFCAIELNNSISYQLEVIDYIKKLFNEK